MIMIAMITATASAMIPMSIQIIDVEPIMDATPSATSRHQDVLVGIALYLTRHLPTVVAVDGHGL